MLNVYLVVNITIKFILTLLYKIFFHLQRGTKETQKKIYKNKINAPTKTILEKEQQLIFLSLKETLKQLFILSFSDGHTSSS